MSIFAICMTKDEEDIIGYTLPRMAAQVDQVLIADNLSTDATRDILHTCANQMGNITISDDPEVAYLQSVKMTRLAEHARDQGADWVVPFDADEVWMLPELSPIPPSVSVLHAELYDHVVTGHDDFSDPDPVTRIAYRRPYPAPLYKVICRTLPGLVIEQGNHSASYPGPIESMGIGQVRHYPYRSALQMARKARNGGRAYAAAGSALPESTGAHWRNYARFLEQGGIEAIEEIFQTWFYEDDPSELIHDPCPVLMPVMV